MEEVQIAQPEQPVKVSAESLGISQGLEYDGDLDFDLGNLMAAERGSIDQERFKSEPDTACREVATQITQSLIARLFQLPSEAIPEGRIAQLPEPTTQLPRAKPLPKPREPTKWEVFAQRKGITKRKRGKEVWDEEAGDYKRRFGYKRAGDESELPIIEAAASDQVGEDPFAALKQEKRERVKAQRQRQVANVKASSKDRGGPVALPPTLKLAAALPAHGKGKPSKRQEIQDDIKAASKQAGVSTASMGKFDERLPGERPGERNIGQKGKAVGPVAAAPGQEGKKALGLVDHILRERADDIVDMDKAVRRVEAERHHQLPGAGHEDSSEDEGKAKGKKGKGKRGAKHTSSKGQRFAAIKRGSGGKQKGGAMKAHKGAVGKASRPGAKAGGKGKGRK
ncbi:hypothetical protein CVIRNUC_000508 [Coccomyxa viridis]|uniref:Ribosome biogenesis regulatory protein n=1 Tax=Coccomyxa viridis TaxID=1274662 RepID=A0AAV1HS09_9CHLO|nr:hypothetical protein CVIRNUC_000508 [Coccomyxa viridis]